MQLLHVFQRRMQSSSNLPKALKLILRGVYGLWVYLVGAVTDICHSHLISHHAGYWVEAHWVNAVNDLKNNDKIC